MNEGQGKVREPHLVYCSATLWKILIFTMKNPGKVKERCIRESVGTLLPQGRSYQFHPACARIFEHHIIMHVQDP